MYKFIGQEILIVHIETVTNVNKKSSVNTVDSERARFKIEKFS